MFASWLHIYPTSIWLWLAFPIPPLMASPSRRGLKRSKWSVEDATSQSKKHKAGTAGHSTHSGSNATHPHCSGRAGAGTGGHFAQLEWVGAQLKASQPVSRPLTTFPNDDNPVTPPLRKGQKKVTWLCLLAWTNFFFSFRNQVKQLLLPTSLLPVLISLVPLGKLIYFFLECPVFTPVQMATALGSRNQLSSCCLEQSPISMLWTICMSLHNVRRNIGSPPLKLLIQTLLVLQLVSHIKSLVFCLAADHPCTLHLTIILCQMSTKT